MYPVHQSYPHQERRACSSQELKSYLESPIQINTTPDTISMAMTGRGGAGMPGVRSGTAAKMTRRSPRPIGIALLLTPKTGHPSLGLSSVRCMDSSWNAITPAFPDHSLTYSNIEFIHGFAHKVYKYP
jgi:hypothetical protein